MKKIWNYFSKQNGQTLFRASMWEYLLFLKTFKDAMLDPGNGIVIHSKLNKTKPFPSLGGFRRTHFGTSCMPNVQSRPGFSQNPPQPQQAPSKPTFIEMVPHVHKNPHKHKERCVQSLNHEKTFLCNSSCHRSARPKHLSEWEQQCKLSCVFWSGASL